MYLYKNLEFENNLEVQIKIVFCDVTDSKMGSNFEGAYFNQHVSD